MSHWTRTAALTVGLAAGVGVGVVWTSPATSLPDGQETLNWLSRAIAPDARPPGEFIGAAPSANNDLNAAPPTTNLSREDANTETEEDLLQDTTESQALERADLATQTVDVFVAQAPRRPAPTEADEGSQTAFPENEGTSTPDDRGSNTQTRDSQEPDPQATPQPQFSPVTPRPLGDRSSGDPEAEIRAIRRELVQLLTRLEALEAQLQSGSDASTSNSEASNSTDSNTTAANGAEPSPRPSPPSNSFFDGPPPPQLSLGTQTISLPGDVLFDFNRSEIRPEAATMLEQVAGILEAMPYSHIQVAGHTDDVGDSEYNLVLSVERATSVQEFLREALPDNGQGYRWTATGYGETAPVAENDSEEGRQRNRRVDLIVSPQ